MSKLVDRAFLPQGSLNAAMKRLKLKRNKDLFIEAVELSKGEVVNISKTLCYHGELCNKIYGWSKLPFKMDNSSNTYFYVELRKIKDADA